MNEPVTERDLKKLESTLRHEIDILRANTGKKIAESEYKTIRWVGLLLYATVAGLIFLLLAIFPK